MFLVTKEVTFDMGHRLSKYQGKCFNLHGHTYRLQVTIASNLLDSNGFVIDFTDLKAILKKITDKIDHKTMLYKHDPINEAMVAITQHDEWFVEVQFEPTAENIAHWIYEQIAEEIFKIQWLSREKRRSMEVASVRLWETPTSEAVYFDGKEM